MLLGRKEGYTVATVLCGLNGKLEMWQPTYEDRIVSFNYQSRFAWEESLGARLSFMNVSVRELSRVSDQSRRMKPIMSSSLLWV